MTKLEELHAHGQSVWLDMIRRGMLVDGELKDLVDDGLRGITSNPAIFKQAIAGSDEYDDAIRTLHRETPAPTPRRSTRTWRSRTSAARATCSTPVWDRSRGMDGFVSLEVDPRLADDTEKTIAEARRLFAKVDRPNVLIKVPGTRAGLPAIETLISEGINVNVTLMFSLRHYDDVAPAYLRGVEKAEDPTAVTSVASLFISRVERAVDRRLDQIGTEEAAEIKGRIAIDNAKQIYRRYREIFFEGDELAAAALARGARPQRVLWASTSTKNPGYSDVRYVEELIGPDTINTMPPETLEAFRDHGDVRGDTITHELDRAGLDLVALDDLGIDLTEVCDELQRAGVRKFVEPFEELLDAIRTKRREVA